MTAFNDSQPIPNLIAYASSVKNLGSEQSGTGYPSGVDRAILGWRSARRFKPDPIPEALLAEILELAVRAPTCRLAQPWRFTVPGAQTTARLAEVGHQVMLEQGGQLAAEGTRKLLLDAPRLVGVSVAYADPGNPRFVDEDFAAVCCAIQNFTLAAFERGLAVWWRSGALVRDSRTNSALQLEPLEHLVGLLHIGYPLACVECELKSAASKTRWLE